VKRTAAVMLAIVALALAASATGAGEPVNVEESFDHQPLARRSWNFCQTAAALNTAAPGAGGLPETAYRFGIDTALGTPGPCNCQIRADCLFAFAALLAGGVDRERDIEPPLYPAPGRLMSAMVDPCRGYDRSRIPARKKLQKNELRLWQEDWPDAEAGYWISLRFRIDGDIDRCGSMRWVGGQFKAWGKDDSPFVAQRFDNAVFHITVEGPHRTEGKVERVIVAKSPGDPDRGSGLQPCENEMTCGETVTCDMTSGMPSPEDCGIAARVTPLGGALPAIDGGRWIEMDYYLRIGGPCDPVRPENCPRLLEVWADKNPVVRVEGRFGVPEAHEGPLNVKVGVYRDLQAGDAGIVVDEFQTRYDPKKSWSPKDRAAN